MPKTVETVNLSTLKCKPIKSLFCITGIDGCGKGTQIQLLECRLEEHEIDVRVVKAYGEAEKESLSHFMRTWEDMTITFIFQGLQRQQYVDALHYLKKGCVVLADRWDESFRAYHRLYGTLSKNRSVRNALRDLTFENKIPEVTFMLDISIEEANRRMVARGMDYFDSKGYKYHLAMRKQYLEIANERNWFIIDGSKTQKEIHEIIYDEVAKRVGIIK